MLALSAGAAGFVANQHGVAVFGGTEITFGGFFTLLATYFLGPWFGGLAAAVAFSITWIEWGHPWALACFTLEAVSVGWLMTRYRLHALKALVRD